MLVLCEQPCLSVRAYLGDGLVPAAARVLGLSPCRAEPHLLHGELHGGAEQLRELPAGLEGPERAQHERQLRQGRGGRALLLVPHTHAQTEARRTDQKVVSESGGDQAGGR